MSAITHDIAGGAWDPDVPAPGDDDAPPESYGRTRPTGRGKRDPAEARAVQIVDLAVAAGAEYAHDSTGTAHVRVTVDDHRETYPVRSREARQYLGRLYWRTHHGVPNVEAMTAALSIIEAEAMHDGPEIAVGLRVAADGNGGLWQDLGGPNWHAVHVTASGWSVGEPAVWLRRSAGMRALPQPTRGGGLDELRVLLPRLDDEQWALLCGWLVAALLPSGPYPPLALSGEQGSCKSTTARMVRGVIDPAAPELRAEPRELRDLVAAMRSSWLVTADNVSRIQPWLSDALCRLSTGGGVAQRELYSDTDEVLVEATRPVLLTGITDYIARPDLLDRAINLTLPPVADEDRRTEADLWRAYEQARPGILGALLDRVVGALRELPGVQLPRPPRMADFARSARAAEVGAREPARFLDAYARLRGAAHETAVDASMLGSALLLTTESLPWEGSAAQLLERLAALVGGEAKGKSWPQTPRAVSGELRRLAPALRGLGWTVDLPRGAQRGRDRLIRLAPPGKGATPQARPATQAKSEQLPWIAPARMSDTNGPPTGQEQATAVPADSQGNGLLAGVACGTPPPEPVDERDWRDS
jgi:hypothetical protein